jgi:MFS family permease
MRTRLIISSAFAASLGWGAILPFQYAYVVDSRAWGALVGMLAGTTFCLGAVVAAPVAGRLTDRYSARNLSVIFALVAALSAVAMGLADAPGYFLAATVGFGAAITATAPASQVLVLDSVEAAARRTVFAYQFTAQALGIAAGAFFAGHVIDLESPAGMWPAFALAAFGFTLSAALLVPLRSHCPVAMPETAGEEGAGGGTVATYRRLAGSRQVRLLALASVALAAGFYGQFDTGLPALALDRLGIDPSVIGTAMALNSVVIVSVQWLVVRATRNRSGESMLIVVGTTWAATWLLLEVALFAAPEYAGALFVGAFVAFAFGETMFAPVLAPLAAAVAPEGTVGTTLGLLAGARNVTYAAGPLVAGSLLALDLPHVFVLLHVAINVAGAALAWRLLQARRPLAVEVDNGGIDDLRSLRV